MAISQPPLNPSPSSSKGYGSKKALEIKRKLLCKKSQAPRTKNNCQAIQNAVKNTSSMVKQAPVNKCLDIVETNYSVMKRAQDVQANLPPEFPSCIKPMLLSHVTGGFWLSLPKPFCDGHMPKEDEHMFTLVDEIGEEYEVKYLARKNGLSGGWRGFSIAHKLLEGDVLVFQLIQRRKFKVYIVRASGLTDLDGAIGLLSLDIVNNGNVVAICEDEEDNYFDTVPLNVHQGNIEGNGMMAIKDKELGTNTSQNGNESDDLVAEVLEGIRFSESIPKFENVKSIDDFEIHVDGLIIDSEIPPHLRLKYYDLCRSQKAFLHENFLKGLNLSLVSGVISETVNISDAIKASKFTNSKKNLTIWDQTLEGFEKLGMSVGFLRSRIKRLVNLAFESQNVVAKKKLERVQAEDEMRLLEAKLSQVKEGVKVLDFEIEELVEESKTIEGVFKKEANAPW